MGFSSIEIASVVFLIIFAILAVPSVFIWIKYIRAGYGVRYGFYGATLICAMRIAAFISELIFYGSNYTNTNAVIAYEVCLTIGYIGLLETQSAMMATWSETHLTLSETQIQVQGKIRILNIVALVLTIYGSTHLNYSDPLEHSSGTDFVRAGVILFLALTVVQGLFVLLGWVRYRQFSQTLTVLTLVILILFWRIVWGVYQTFNRTHSALNFKSSNTKYVVALTLVPEVLAMVLLIGLGFHTLRAPDFKTRRQGKQSEAEAYNLEAQRNQQQTGVSRY